MGVINVQFLINNFQFSTCLGLNNDATAISNATAQSFRPSLSGYYKVQVNNAGCISLFSDPYYYLVTSVINIASNTIGSYKLVPNPATERLLVQAVNANNKINIQIIAANGKMIINQEFIGNISIAMSFFTPGMYTVLLTDNKTKKQESKQIIKQ